MPRCSMARYQRIYNRLRKRFFMEAPNGYIVPPLAKDLIWTWVPRNGGVVAAVLWDDDNTPMAISVSPKTVTIYADLLHELTHLRLGPKHKKSCRGHSPVWKREQLRLARLGAPLL